MTTTDTDSVQTFSPGEACSFSVELTPFESPEPGFNQYGVRVHDDGSADVIFKAMQPGVRKGFRIDESFLTRVAGNFSGPVPFMLDHSGFQLKQVGRITAAKFSEGYLRLMGHIPNTGSSIKTDVLADLTYDPPAITDGSVGFANDAELYETDDGEIAFYDARIQEFSLTPFPGGYDDGGLSPAFSEAVDKYRAARGDEATDVDDSADSRDERNAGRSRARVSQSFATISETDI
jgi:hypothetical protein